VYTPTTGVAEIVNRLTTPEEKLAVLEPCKIPPSIRPAQPDRGAYWICVICAGEPRFSPTQLPLAVGASK